MATETGVLQALWAEVRPAVEARDPALCRPISRLVNRGKSAEALRRFEEVLDLPPTREGEALSRVAALLGAEGLISGLSHPSQIKLRLWTEVTGSRRPVLLNCRLFFDEPYSDRIWLQRHGRWILYRWDGARMAGTSLAGIRAKVAADPTSEGELLMVVSVCQQPFQNPKLPSWQGTPSP